MNVRSANDEALLKALQHKSVDALEELYDRHHRTALAVAYRVLRDRSLAEDVIQEAFLAVWRQPESFRPERGSCRSWLFSIVRHRAIDITRGRSFAKERLSLEEIRFEPRYPDVWQEVSTRLDQELVRRVVDTLPEAQREALMLAYFDGQTQQEISERTGVPLGTVKGRMRLG
ncbi:MAG: sigma-70 family RNA polymerase sigma factor, partial [Chloroflexi bacterium]|nr:sigma-70 family RNA polymerase sigma factor [Chloroflexota bacterium]